MNKIRLILLAAAIAAGAYFFAHGDTGKPEKIKTDDKLGILRVSNVGVAQSSYIDAYIFRVSDGDTVEINYGGKNERVRLLNVDTPESVMDGVPVQKFSKEAADYTRKKLLNKKVKLVFETGIRDRFGRLLAHVLLEDGAYYNAELVREGYARAEVLSPNTALREYFLDLQEQAIKNRVGLWNLAEEERPFIKNKKGEYVPKFYEK